MDAVTGALCRFFVVAYLLFKATFKWSMELLHLYPFLKRSFFPRKIPENIKKKSFMVSPSDHFYNYLFNLFLVDMTTSGSIVSFTKLELYFLTCFHFKSISHTLEYYLRMIFI